MAFRYDGKDIGSALGMALLDKQARKETPVAFGYENGSPQKYSRMANENRDARALVQQYIEDAGGLGVVANDKRFKPGQEYFKGFMEQEMNSVVGREVPQSGGMA